jgi:hypothetical protein
MIAERRRLLGNYGNSSSYCRAISPENTTGRDGLFTQAQLRRYALRHTLWTGTTMPGWHPCRAYSIRLPCTEDSVDWSTISNAVSSTIIATLRKLRVLCNERDADIVKVALRLDSCPSGLRLQVVASAIAVAYCKTAYLYRANPLNDEVADTIATDFRADGSAAPLLRERGLLLPGSVYANQVLAQYEVLGLFCLILKQVASQRKTVQVERIATGTIRACCRES